MVIKDQTNVVVHGTAEGQLIFEVNLSEHTIWLNQKLVEDIDSLLMVISTINNQSNSSEKIQSQTWASSSLRKHLNDSYSNNLDTKEPITKILDIYMDSDFDSIGYMSLLINDYSEFAEKEGGLLIASFFGRRFLPVQGKWRPPFDEKVLKDCDSNQPEVEDKEQTEESHFLEVCFECGSSDIANGFPDLCRACYRSEFEA